MDKASGVVETIAVDVIHEADNESENDLDLKMLQDSDPDLSKLKTLKGSRCLNVPFEAKSYTGLHKFKDTWPSLYSGPQTHCFQDSGGVA